MIPIYPILRKMGPVTEIAATAFAVAPGIVVTAAHVLEASGRGSLWLATNPADLKAIEPLNWLRSYPGVDLAFASADIGSSMLQLSSTPPALGDSLRYAGYVGQILWEPEAGGSVPRCDLFDMNVTCIRRRVLNISAGTAVTEKTYPAVFTSDAPPPGVSGGPLFNADHEVVGLYSLSAPGREVQESYPTVGSAVDSSLIVQALLRLPRES